MVKFIGAFSIASLAPGFNFWAHATQVGVQYQEYSQIFNTKNLDGMPFPIREEGRNKFEETQTVTSFHDKDDTSVCSGGKFPYGTDEWCAGHGAVYAGFVALVRALNRYTTSDSNDGTKFIQVSARPRDPTGFLLPASSSFAGTQVDPILDPKKEEGGLWSVWGAVTTLFGIDEETNGWKKTGKHKTKDMERRKGEIIAAGKGTELFIWNGDDGQGDAKAAEEVRDKEITNVSLIHLVGGRPFETGDPREGGSSNDIVFYLNYAHLASMLVDMGLISKNQAKDVYNSILNSAFGKSCCNDTKCSEYSGLNEEDGTCGDDDDHPETRDTAFNFEDNACHGPRYAAFNLMKTGPTEDEKLREQAVYRLCPSAEKLQARCDCSDIVDDEGFGKCSKLGDDNKEGCYVKSPLFNNCGDAKPATSKGFENQLWSTEACL